MSTDNPRVSKSAVARPLSMCKFKDLPNPITDKDPTLYDGRSLKRHNRAKIIKKIVLWYFYGVAHLTAN